MTKNSVNIFVYSREINSIYPRNKNNVLQIPLQIFCLWGEEKGQPTSFAHFRISFAKWWRVFICNNCNITYLIEKIYSKDKEIKGEIKGLGLFYWHCSYNWGFVTNMGVCDSHEWLWLDNTRRGWCQRTWKGQWLISMWEQLLSTLSKTF